jgi:SHS2 domain-containing protein
MHESYEELEHTADWAIRVIGNDLSHLFTRSSNAMLDLMKIVPVDGTPVSREVQLQAPDTEGLLVSWLEEILFLIDTEHVAPVSCTCRVSKDGQQLNGEIQTLPMMSMRNSIKAITYNELNVLQTNDGFEVQIVFDV